MVRFRRFFSTDSAKAAKARSFGYLNAINYMAPHKSAGVGNLCGNASPACIFLCLGPHSGRAAIHAEGKSNAILDSRLAKSRLFFADRKAFMREMEAGIERAILEAVRFALKLCVRPNGASDIPWEGIRDENGRTILELFPDVQFVDYTKSEKRAIACAEGRLPANYHLTFSRSETNFESCRRVLQAGGQVAVVSSRARPVRWHGYVTVDGDQHDLRHLDGRGVVVWLSPKGAKAKADKSGFVVR